METICLYLENRENRTILTEMLQDSFRIIESNDGFPDEPIDLCITDGIILDRNADTFFTRKQSAIPLFLPILLLTAHYSPDLFTRDWWQVVDEVVLLPSHKAILLKRIQSLLRLRNQSFALQKEKEELADANARISLGMKAGKISYWEVDLATGEIMLSDEWKEQLECPEHFDDAQEELFRHIHPDDVELFKNDLQQIIRAHAGTLSVTYRMSCDGKDYSWYILRSTFVNDSQGNPLRLLVSQIDITEQKKIELQSIEREKKIVEANSTIQKHRLLVDAIMKSTTAGIVYVNNEGCVADVNKTITDMVGLSESEIVGKKERADLWGIIDPVDHSTPPCSSLPVYRSMNEQKIIPPEEYLFRKDGVLKTFTLSAAPVYANDHEVTGSISVWQDITERKTIENELRQAHELIKNITMGTDDMIAAQDKNFNYIFFNDAYHRIFKKLWSWDLKIGSNVVEALSPWPSQREKVIKLWTRAFNGETFRETGEIGPTDTSKRFFEMQFSPLRGEAGSVTGAAHIMRDITETILARDELRKSQERLVGVLESMPDAFISFDTELKFTYVNRHMESLHKVKREELIGKNIRDVFKDEEAKVKIQMFEKVLAKQEPETRILFITDGDGWFEFRTFPNPDGISVFVKNVSEQKIAEAALKESETRFRALADNISQFAWMANPDGNIFWYNKRWFEYTSTDLEKMKEWGWEKTLHPDHFERVKNKMQHSWDTGELWEDTFQLKKHDGTYRWFLSRAMPIRNDKNEIQLWFGTNTDISDLLETEDKLKNALMDAEEGRNILSALMKNIPLGITIADAPDVRIRMISEFGRKMMEEAGQELIGDKAHLKIGELTIRRADGAIPDSADELPLNRAIVNGEMIKNEEWIVIRKDGTEIPILCNAGPIRDDKGNKITGGVVGWSDITELRKYRKELEQYAEELATANSDLEAFTYSVSHDLRTPLMTIRSFAQFLLEDYTEKLEEEGLDYLRRIGAGVDKMQALIDDMLTLSRVSRHEMSREDVDLSAMVRNYLQELKESEPGRPAEFIVQDGVYLNADPRMLHLALENLLRNAWKFTSRNPVTRIEFSTVSRYNQTVCFIRDNGTGFDMQFAQKIFEAFKRVHTEEEYGGTGVGLSIVQRVIARHGGKVWAEGELGKGATFYFTLR